MVDAVVGLLGIVLLDQRVGRLDRRPALEILRPALERGVDEALDQLLLLGRELARDGDRRLVGAEARVGDQQHLGFLAERLGDRIGLRGDEALLDRLRIGEERRHVEVVGPKLRVAEAVLLAQVGPEGRAAAVGDQQRPALHLLEAVEARAGMGDHHLRILLEDRRDGEERRLLADEGEGLEAVRHDHVDPAGQQQLADVEAGPAGPEVDVDPTRLVEAGGDRLVVAAMLGLRAPVGVEGELVERCARARRASGSSTGPASRPSAARRFRRKARSWVETRTREVEVQGKDFADRQVDTSGRPATAASRPRACRVTARPDSRSGRRRHRGRPAPPAAGPAACDRPRSPARPGPCRRSPGHCGCSRSCSAPAFSTIASAGTPRSIRKTRIASASVIGGPPCWARNDPPLTMMRGAAPRFHSRAACQMRSAPSLRSGSGTSGGWAGAMPPPSTTMAS